MFAEALAAYVNLYVFDLGFCFAAASVASNSFVGQMQCLLVLMQLKIHNNNA